MCYRVPLYLLLSLALAAPLPGAAAPGDAGSSAAPLHVVIDAGHGGHDSGAVGVGGLQEKRIVQAVALRAAAELEARGYQVTLTRDSDTFVPLDERVRAANELGADLFISLHCNSVAGPSQRRARGIETYFLSAEATDEAARRLASYENEAASPEALPLDPTDPLSAILADLAVSSAHDGASRLAEQVHLRLVEATGWRDRGVRQAPFVVLNGARMPAILVELGFLSHPREGRALAEPDTQSQLAEALSDGVDGFRALFEPGEGAKVAQRP